jgi:ABC-2 type transport system permease protein
VIPTTHASLILQYAMGFPQALENSWSPELGFAVIILYIVGFALLAKTKAVWRED